MKGTIFLKPLEYNIEAFGEKWCQGEKIAGSLAVKNHGLEKMEILNLRVMLCEGNYKKIKSKDPSAWKCLSEMLLDEGVHLNASEEKKYSWDFKLAEDCLITDKMGSPLSYFF